MVCYWIPTDYGNSIDFASLYWNLLRWGTSFAMNLVTIFGWFIIYMVLLTLLISPKRFNVLGLSTRLAGEEIAMILVMQIWGSLIFAALSSVAPAAFLIIVGVIGTAIFLRREYK